ncbi:unnamed protein product [Linum trigynum]|uniref:Uncharacterized protein n=1 Tax=Linum trigynum TaxID=586398 RepID=A0AAV2C9B2_9ROSI
MVHETVPDIVSGKSTTVGYFMVKPWFNRSSTVRSLNTAYRFSFRYWHFVVEPAVRYGFMDHAVESIMEVRRGRHMLTGRHANSKAETRLNYEK